MELLFSLLVNNDITALNIEGECPHFVPLLSWTLLHFPYFAME